ncbi:MAG: phenylalanine--tRNA ligase subunit beta, partial [Oscillospiraceae bacterium]|nr:phenylalanine--tRNA ligase subunit beta [Oscillospiraceae bacterium]
MNLSMRWLNEFVDVQMPPREFAEAITMSGSKVECYEVEGAEIQNVVTAKILDIKKHENSDHLVICQVDIGKEQPIQIVTGASNLKVGDIVPAALDGS